MTPKKIVMGIDPGTQKTGYAFLEVQNTKLRFITSGLIQSKKTSLENRLENIYIKLLAVLQTYQPNAVAIETIFYALNAKSSLILAQARGVILLACKIQKSSIFEFTPTQIKKSTTGNGNANKEQVSRVIKLLFKTSDNLSLDETDAIATAICLANYR